MKNLFLTSLLILATTCSLWSADKTDLDRLQGKWEVKKTNDDGGKVTQTIEMKGDKMTFKIVNSAGEMVLVAKADVKSQKLGAFNTFTITNLKYGKSEDALESADEERSYVYQLGYDTLTIVSDIDAQRDQSPRIDVYKKIAAK